MNNFQKILATIGLTVILAIFTSATGIKGGALFWIPVLYLYRVIWKKNDKESSQ